MSGVDNRGAIRSADPLLAPSGGERGAYCSIAAGSVASLRRAIIAAVFTKSYMLDPGYALAVPGMRKVVGRHLRSLLMSLDHNRLVTTALYAPGKLVSAEPWWSRAQGLSDQACAGTVVEIYIKRTQGGSPRTRFLRSRTCRFLTS